MNDKNNRFILITIISTLMIVSVFVGLAIVAFRSISTETAAVISPPSQDGNVPVVNFPGAIPQEATAVNGEIFEADPLFAEVNINHAKILVGDKAVQLVPYPVDVRDEFRLLANNYPLVRVEKDARERPKMMDWEPFFAATDWDGKQRFIDGASLLYLADNRFDSCVFNQGRKLPVFLSAYTKLPNSVSYDEYEGISILTYTVLTLGETRMVHYPNGMTVEAVKVGYLTSQFQPRTAWLALSATDPTNNNARISFFINQQYERQEFDLKDFEGQPRVLQFKQVLHIENPETLLPIWDNLNDVQKVFGITSPQYQGWYDLNQIIYQLEYLVDADNGGTSEIPLLVQGMQTSDKYMIIPIDGFVMEIIGNALADEFSIDEMVRCFK